MVVCKPTVLMQKCESSVWGHNERNEYMKQPLRVFTQPFVEELVWNANHLGASVRVRLYSTLVHQMDIKPDITPQHLKVYQLESRIRKIT